MKSHPFALPFLPAAAAPAVPARQHALRHSSLLTVERPLGRRVACESGQVWLTFDGCREDYILAAGQSLECREPGRLLVSALQDATVRVD